MKAAIFAVASLINFSANAAVIGVNSNMFMASGPATPNYFINLNKITAEVKKVSSAELGVFSFAGATVNAEAGTVRYTFQRMEKSDIVEVCWSQVSFTTKEDSAAGPVVSDVKAQLDCYKNQD
ncbi:hypothetical protein D3C87_1300400 [compost metagenome]